MSRFSSIETKFHWVNDASMPGDEERQQILDTTLQAATAKTNPYQSDFHIQAACMNENGQIATGGNREKTLSDALHGEVSALNHSFQRFGEKAIKIISFYKPTTDLDVLNTIVPCGPCRDTLLQETNPDELFMAAGNENIITVKKLRDYLKTDFQSIMTIETDLESVTDANQAIMMSDIDYLPEEMYEDVYGVCLVDKDGNRWIGGLETTAGYNEVSPGYAARIAWRNTIKPGEKRPDLDRITVVQRHHLPTGIEYRDRQALLELDEMLMQKHGRTEPLRVDLVHIDDGGPVEAAITTTQEWLPHPFSAASLGLPTPENQAERLRYLETIGDE